MNEWGYRAIECVCWFLFLVLVLLACADALPWRKP